MGRITMLAVFAVFAYNLVSMSANTISVVSQQNNAVPAVMMVAAR